jgi:hypothetical protein
MFIRREPRPAARYTGIRVGLFFFGAGLWLAGVVRDNQTFTAAAIVVVLGAVLLGLADRRNGVEERESDDEA